MSKSRTATNILEARGAFKKNPDRKRVEPVCSSTFPEVAPSYMEPLEVKCWHEIKKAVPGGVLQGSDVFAVELAASLRAEWLSDRKGMATSRIAQMRGVFGTLGLSPSDRAKLAAPATDDDDEF